MAEKYSGGYILFCAERQSGTVISSCFQRQSGKFTLYACDTCCVTVVKSFSMTACYNRLRIICEVPFFFCIKKYRLYTCVHISRCVISILKIVDHDLTRFTTMYQSRADPYVFLCFR